MTSRQWDRLWEVALLALIFCALGALLLAASGCSLPEQATTPPLSQRARVYWLDPPPPAAERARLLAYVDRAERVYRARFRCGPVPVAALVFDPARTLRRVHGYREPLLGLCVGGWPGATLWLPIGGLSPAQATIHELHHASGIGDPEHKDPSWRVVRWLTQALGGPGD